MIVFLLGVVINLTGFALIQIDGLPQLPTDSVGRWSIYAAATSSSRSSPSSPTSPTAAPARRSSGSTAGTGASPWR